VVVPLLASVALIQSSLLSRLSLAGATIDLMVLIVVAWSLLRGAREGIVWGFIGGLALDFLSGAALGSCAFTLTLVAYVASLGKFTIYRTNPLFPSLVALVAKVVHDCVFLAVLTLAGNGVAWRNTLVHVTLPTALLCALLMPVVHRGLSWVHRRTMPEEIQL
jgi:rod shape-determining protein MreD